MKPHARHRGKNRETALTAFALELVLITPHPIHAQTATRPNIVCIMMDKLAWGEPGVYGGCARESLLKTGAADAFSICDSVAHLVS